MSPQERVTSPATFELCEEVVDLNAVLGTLTPEQWRQPTSFLDWTPWDVIAHLHYFDRIALLAMSDPAAFYEVRDALQTSPVGPSNVEHSRCAFAAHDPATLRDLWCATCMELADRLRASHPDVRLPWFGPNMGVYMFSVARLMETWAHGQAVYDLLRMCRPVTQRLRHIALLGVKTYRWTFQNRGWSVPEPPPNVRLTGPSNETWEWAASSNEQITGTAFEFCQVVTQTRNVADTNLRVTGAVAARWMAVAQCFAGPPVTPPKPGQRVW